MLSHAWRMCDNPGATLLMEDLQFSQATADDIPHLQVLFNEYYQDMHRMFPSMYRPVAGDAVSEAEISSIVDGASAGFTIARTGGEIVGLVCMREAGTGEVAFLESRRYGLIRYVFVRREMRRQGIGRRLMELAIEWSRKRGLDDIELTVWHGNACAMELYRSLGFRPMTMQLSLGVRTETIGSA